VVLPGEAFVACVAECRVIRLVFHEQIRLCGSVGLMASRTINGYPNLGVVGRIHLIDHRVTIHRVT
jgi:hypothetical protein